jgi:hypothetical protein
MGNQKSKQPNAQKHGVFAATAILPGENRQEFEELHSAVIQEWAPDGVTEEDAVLSIAKAIWRKRRVQKFLEVHLAQNSDLRGMTELGVLRVSAATFFSDDLFKQELPLDERLAAILDRAVKRLIQTKAMKQMLGQTGAERVNVQPRTIVARRTSNDRHN